ncbi:MULTISPECIES: type II toxin-antitoxin system VapB family antitoxin [unclassified Endozoicomonas]|uniref:type II toxin-antitoxin system VapB family antitoxin n=1 Tax=unclassified Endozoicomonas TaxID=2644528 RepID=UPI003BAEAA8E
MRIHTVIDETLMHDALEITGLKTKREAIEKGLRLLIKLSRQELIRQYRGKLNWEGDLDCLRVDDD